MFRTQNFRAGSGRVYGSGQFLPALIITYRLRILLGNYLNQTYIKYYTQYSPNTPEYPYSDLSKIAYE